MLWLCPRCGRSSWGLGVVVGGCARAVEDWSFLVGEDSRESGAA
jgi:hypothetical protein